MSLDNRPVYSRRLPVRRGALPRRGRAGRRLGLPLPHVPEGVSGNFYQPLVSVAAGEAHLDARRAEIFQSSNSAGAASARDCGTPLTFDAPDGIAARDRAPSTIRRRSRRPSSGASRRKLPYVDAIPALPGEDTMEDHESARASSHDLVSYQHPDHDTDQWPPSSSAGKTKHNEQQLRTLYPEIEPFDSGMLDVGDGHTHLLGARRHQGRQAGGLPAWRPGRRHLAQAAAGVRPESSTTSSCSTSAVAASRRRMPASTPTPPGTSSPTSSGCANMAGFDKWLVFGGSWGSTLALAYAETHPEPCQRAGPARHLHADQAGARLVLSVRRLGDVPGQMGALPGADPRSRARRHDGRLPQAADRQRPQGASRGARSLEPVGRRDHHAAARPRRPAASSARRISRSPLPASRTIISSMAAGSRRTS